MACKYIHYTEITRKVLDSIKVGDLVKVNDWKKPLKVKAVSENYFVMAGNLFGKPLYSVCSKLPGGFNRNAMVADMFHCGTDNWVFGSPLSCDHERLYFFENEEANTAYLQSFENGETELSVRSSVAIYDLYVKEGEN